MHDAELRLLVVPIIFSALFGLGNIFCCEFQTICVVAQIYS